MEKRKFLNYIFSVIVDKKNTGFQWWKRDFIISFCYTFIYNIYNTLKKIYRYMYVCHNVPFRVLENSHPSCGLL